MIPPLVDCGASICPSESPEPLPLPANPIQKNHELWIGGGKSSFPLLVTLESTKGKIRMAISYRSIFAPLFLTSPREVLNEVSHLGTVQHLTYWNSCEKARGSRSYPMLLHRYFPTKSLFGPLDSNPHSASRYIVYIHGIIIHRLSLVNEPQLIGDNCIYDR